VITNRSTSRFAATVIAGLVVFAAVVSPAAAASAASTDTADIYSGLNSARASAGKSALAHNASLDAVALAWAKQMAANKAMSHNPDTGSQIPAGWTGWGENVAHGFPTGAATNDGWIASPEHYANMVGDFTDVGIAFVAAGGSTWAVEVFAAYPTTAAAASSVLAPAVTAPADATDEPASSDTASSDTASSAAAMQPVAYVGLVAVPVAIALILLLVMRARRKRVVDGSTAR